LDPDSECGSAPGSEILASSHLDVEGTDGVVDPELFMSKPYFWGVPVGFIVI
jgi:hypothetical protein